MKKLLMTMVAGLALTVSGNAFAQATQPVTINGKVAKSLAAPRQLSREPQLRVLLTAMDSCRAQVL
jgi:hypothetical protein